MVSQVLLIGMLSGCAYLPMSRNDRRETSTLEQSTQIIITAIADDNIVYFTEVGTGVKGEIHYTTENEDGTGIVYVNGLEEASYFEFLPYSG